MADSRQSRNLALEIGLYRNALIVNAIFNQMKTRPAFATLFDARKSHDDEKACLTYFWWVVLGGDRFNELDSEVIQGCGPMGISRSLFGEWLALFRQVALPIIGTDLTDAWMLTAVQVAEREHQAEVWQREEN